MYLGRDFPPFENQSARILGADVSNVLAVGETITRVTSRLRTLSGADALPANHLPVPPQSFGAVVSQLVSFNDPTDLYLGNTYALTFSVVTSAGRTLLPWARLNIAQGFGISAYPGGAPTAGAQSITLPTQAPYFVLPTALGGYIGQDLPPANQTETLSYGYDFEPALSPGETILSASAYLAILDGVDPAVLGDPSVYSVGSPLIDGSQVTQMLKWPGAPDLTANVYGLNIVAVTSANQALNAWARIVINAVS